MLMIVYFHSLHPFEVLLCLGPNAPNSLLLFIAEKTAAELWKKGEKNADYMWGTVLMG